MCLRFLERHADDAVHGGEHQRDPAPPGGDSSRREHGVHDGRGGTSLLQIRWGFTLRVHISSAVHHLQFLTVAVQRLVGVPPRISVSNQDQCILPGSMYPTRISVSYQDQCIQPGSVYPTRINVSYQDQCIQPGSVYPPRISVSYQDQCIQQKSKVSVCVIIFSALDCLKTAGGTFKGVLQLKLDLKSGKDTEGNCSFIP